MGTIWVREFSGGLDSRRLPETTKGGALLRAEDGHINRGSEFEQRAAFVKVYSLPAGATKGMAFTKTQMVVFGKGTTPAGLPSTVSYQHVVHPVDPTLEISRIQSWELFEGKIYVVVQFEDGSLYHFYDGVRVANYDEKRARTLMTFTGGTTGDEVVSITIDGVDILGSAVPWAGSAAQMADAVANEINSHLSSPDYTAVAYGARVAILAAVHGAAYNGLAVSVTAPGISYSLSSTSLAGGSDGAGAIASTVLTLTGGTGTDTVTSIKVGGIEILGATVTFNTDLATTAGLIAAQITAFVSNPEYTAVAAGADITISAALVGALWNGLTVATTSSGLTFSAAAALSGGADITYQSGKFVRTGNQKIFGLTESEWHFSGIKAPTEWISQNTTGAGFVDLSNEASNTETLTAIAKYQKNQAIFSYRNIQIWYADPDPANNVQVQVLNNTGTRSPHSVTQYGDNDLFYLDESGVRSLRARDASNAAATTDIGVPVDTLVIEKLQSLTFDQREDIVSLIEPSSGRYWLIMRDTIFVFSFFREASVSAWSRYNPGFVTDVADVFNRRVYLRSGDDIYVYGGLGSVPVYDSTQPVAWLPYLDADKPTVRKTMTGIDVACRGEWLVEIGLNPQNLDASDKICTVVDSTYVGPEMPALGESTHFGLRLTCLKGPSASKPAVLSAAALHFTGDQDADG